jgi:Protein of unknown function (DUF1524)
MAISRLPLVAFGVAALFALAACDPMLTDSTGLGTASSTAPTSGATSDTAAGATLAELHVAPDGPMTGYSRDRFGDGWATQSDGCESRVDVLLDDGTHVTHHGCTVVSGHWVSLYDGVVVTSPHKLDIDHIVPLANAWVTGARAWTTAQRVAFANDVHRELVAVTAHSNRSKGDEAPPGYEPPARSDDCQYAERWITVKSAYHLTITSAEHDALASMLATCPS